MTDQVPCCGQALCAGVLPFPFLHAVFTEVTHARFKRVANRAGRMRFRNCNQCNLFGIPARATRCSRDSLANQCQIFPDGRLCHPHIQIQVPSQVIAGIAPNALRKVYPQAWLDYLVLLVGTQLLERAPLQRSVSAVRLAFDRSSKCGRPDHGSARKTYRHRRH